MRPRPSFKAIAAMSENRVIGLGNALPWHLPEDFKWFKRVTTGHTLVMGRKTFQSIGKALPGRLTLVLSRSGFSHPGVESIRHLDEVPAHVRTGDVFICGGAEVYAQALPCCTELYLTRVKRTVVGDAYFPPFEHLFERKGSLLETPDFVVEHWTRRSDPGLALNPESGESNTGFVTA